MNLNLTTPPHSWINLSPLLTDQHPSTPALFIAFGKIKFTESDRQWRGWQIAFMRGGQFI